MVLHILLLLLCIKIDIQASSSPDPVRPTKRARSSMEHQYSHTTPTTSILSSQAHMLVLSDEPEASAVIYHASDISRDEDEEGFEKDKTYEENREESYDPYIRKLDPIEFIYQRQRFESFLACLQHKSDSYCTELKPILQDILSVKKNYTEDIKTDKQSIACYLALLCKDYSKYKRDGLPHWPDLLALDDFMEAVDNDQPTPARLLINLAGILPIPVPSSFISEQQSEELALQCLERELIAKCAMYIETYGYIDSVEVYNGLEQNVKERYVTDTLRVSFSIRRSIESVPYNARKLFFTNIARCNQWHNDCKKMRLWIAFLNQNVQHDGQPVILGFVEEE